MAMKDTSRFVLFLYVLLGQRQATVRHFFTYIERKEFAITKIVREKVTFFCSEYYLSLEDDQNPHQEEPGEPSVSAEPAYCSPLFY